MHNYIVMLVFLVVQGAVATAQPTGVLGEASPDNSPPPSGAAYVVPFATAGNLLELTIAAPQGSSDADDLLVTIASVPEWIRFDNVEVGTTISDEDEPVARLTFEVLRSAPVGQAAPVRIEVRDSSGVLLAVKELQVEAGAPVELALHGPRPNPASQQTALAFDLPAPARVRIEVYDMIGRRVALLVDGDLEAGSHEARLGVQALATGGYVARLFAESDGGVQTKVQRLTVIR